MYPLMEDVRHKIIEQKLNRQLCIFYKFDRASRPEVWLCWGFESHTLWSKYMTNTTPHPTLGWLLTSMCCEVGRRKKCTFDPLCGLLQTIHIAVVCAGHSASRQVVTLIKSILFYRHNPVHFHFISDSAAELILSTLFQTWKLPEGLFWN